MIKLVAAVTLLVTGAYVAGVFDQAPTDQETIKPINLPAAATPASTTKNSEISSMMPAQLGGLTINIEQDASFKKLDKCVDIAKDFSNGAANPGSFEVLERKLNAAGCDSFKKHKVKDIPAIIQ